MPVGQHAISLHAIALILASGVILAGICAALKFTRAGLIARPVMQNPGMAQALGVNATFVYMATFGIGAAVTGLARLGQPRGHLRRGAGPRRRGAPLRGADPAEHPAAGHHRTHLHATSSPWRRSTWPTPPFPWCSASRSRALFGAGLGCFMFYGRLSGVYLGLVTLIFWKLVDRAAGPEYAIGAARLGGFDGIPPIPILNVCGDADADLMPAAMFQAFMVILIVVYVGLRLINTSDFGRVSVPIRENETRAGLLRLRRAPPQGRGGSRSAPPSPRSGAMWATYRTFIDPTPSPSR